MFDTLSWSTHRKIHCSNSVKTNPIIFLLYFSLSRATCLSSLQYAIQWSTGGRNLGCTSIWVDVSNWRYSLSQKLDLCGALSAEHCSVMLSSWSVRRNHFSSPVLSYYSLQKYYLLHCTQPNSAVPLKKLFFTPNICNINTKLTTLGSPSSPLSKKSSRTILVSLLTELAYYIMSI